MGRQDATLVVDQRHIMTRDLAFTLLAPQLTHSLNYTKQPTSGTRMGVGQHAAVSIDGQLPIDSCVASLNHCPGTTAFAKA